MNRQTECADGPSLEVDGISIERRRDGYFPAATLQSHPKGWINTWFYCKNTTPANENPLLGYKEDRLPMDLDLPRRIVAKEHAEAALVYPKLKALLANALTGDDLTRC